MDKPTSPIKAILYDADGVVINPSLQYALYLDLTYGITREGTKDFFQGKFLDCLTGKSELREVLPPYLKAWGWQGSADDFVDLWLVMEDCVDARLMERIQNLRSSGFYCGLATLQERNRAEYMKSNMRFTELFDGLFFSCEIGWLKSHKEFYQAVQERTGFKGKEILFWDDNLENVETARAAGWLAEYYFGFEAFERTLKQYIH